MANQNEKPRLVIYTAKGQHSFCPEDQECLCSAASVQFISSPNTRDLDSFLQETESADILAVSPRSYPGLSVADLKKMKNLKAVSVPTTGTEWLDRSPFEACKIPLINVPDFSSHACAEFTWGLILDSIRSISEAKSQAKRFGRRVNGLLGSELRGKTLGVVGFGNIGQRVAKFGQVFGMKVLAYDRLAIESDFAVPTPLDTLLANSQIVSLHLPLTGATRFLFDKSLLQYFRKDAILINTARPDLVHLEDVAEALAHHRLRNYIFDSGYWEPERVKMAASLPGVTVVPHISWYTQEAVENEMSLWTQSLVDWIDQSQ